MATRMQQRRGTASQWSVANPVLAAGEIGVESDTAKFKIGDGVNTWTDLDYFETSESASGTFIEDTEKGAANGVATLDGNANVPLDQLSNATTYINDKVSKENGTVTTASTSLSVVRNITISTSEPTGGSDGDVWMTYLP